MRKNVLFVAIVLIIVMGITGVAGAVENNTTETTPNNDTTVQEPNQSSGSDTGIKVEIIPVKPASEQVKDAITQANQNNPANPGNKVEIEPGKDGVVKDPTPWIKPMSIETFGEWLLGIGYRFLGVVTNVSYVVFAIVIVLGAIAMVLPSFHHHPVMKYTGLGLILGGFLGYVIVLIYPLILGLLRGAVNGI